VLSDLENSNFDVLNAWSFSKIRNERERDGDSARLTRYGASASLECANLLALWYVY